MSGQKGGNSQRTEDEMVNVRKSVSVLNNEGGTARERIKKKNWGEKMEQTSAPQITAKEKQFHRKVKQSH